jgi:hypothetical protein
LSLVFIAWFITSTNAHHKLAWSLLLVHVDQSTMYFQSSSWSSSRPSQSYTSLELNFPARDESWQVPSIHDSNNPFVILHSVTAMEGADSIRLSWYVASAVRCSPKLCSFSGSCIYSQMRSADAVSALRYEGDGGLITQACQKGTASLEGLVTAQTDRLLDLSILEKRDATSKTYLSFTTLQLLYLATTQLVYVGPFPRRW